MSSSQSSRRALLGYGIKALTAGAACNLSLFGAPAQSRGALVCLYLNGGNDGNNLAVPLNHSYEDYRRARGGLGLDSASLATAKPATFEGEIGFHPALAPLKDLFDARVLAVVANLGDTGSNWKPLAITNPLSHFDSSVRYLKTGHMTLGWAAALANSAAPAEAVFSDFPDVGFLRKSGVSLVASSAPSGSRLTGMVLSAVRADSFRTAFPDTQLGGQLRQVVRTLVGSRLTNPIFVVPMSGYDTHSNQLARQSAMFEELSAAMVAFHSATVELGISEQVTTFTWSEFGRQTVPNSTGGTNHGWGSTHLVMGGSVLGGDVYGTFPSFVAGGADDATGAGVWMPNTSRDQYFATLARWSGVNSGELYSLLPGLRSLESPTLRFLG